MHELSHYVEVTRIRIKGIMMYRENMRSKSKLFCVEKEW
jgi:hypothetical protein